MTVDQKISQTFMGQAVNMNQKIAMGSVSEILAVDANGVSTVKVTYSKIQVNWDFPYNIVYLSSATPLSLFSDKISHCSQQFNVSNLILELFQQKDL